MSRKPKLDAGWISRLVSSSDPLTYFFYELEGARAVPARVILENGVNLWHEAVFSNEVYDNSYLWEEARILLENPDERPPYSWVEWLRRRIILGSIVPKRWGNRRPYPYKGLLISAVYFQEARRLCEEENYERAWQLIALAYYHLGLNTTRSSTHNTSRAAKEKHSDRTSHMRGMVLGILDAIKARGTASSIEGAKDQVVDLMRAHRNNIKIKSWLDEFDALVPEKTKGRTTAKVKNDVFVRIRNMLDNWSLPSGPYPEIAEAFSHFSRQKTRASNLTRIVRTTTEEFPIEESAYSIRLISYMDEFTLTEKLSIVEEEDEADLNADPP